jgi:hypothetical protein
MTYGRLYLAAARLILRMSRQTQPQLLLLLLLIDLTFYASVAFNQCMARSVTDRDARPNSLRIVHLSFTSRPPLERRRELPMTTTRPQSSQSPQSLQSLDDLLAAQARRSSIARMGAYAMYEKHGSAALSVRRMETRMKRYEERVDPTGELARRDPQDLASRVDAALKLDMAKVRYARSQRAADRRALQEMLLHTPPDDVSQLGAIAAALALNGESENQAPSTPRRGQTEAASVSAEAAPKPHNLRKQAKIVSSDGGAGSVSHAPRRRQTSTPSGSSTKSMATPQKKATKSYGKSKHSDSRN